MGNIQQQNKQVTITDDTDSEGIIHSEKHTPIKKLKRNLEAELFEGKKLAVLVSTGSFNPLHKMHVHLLEVAKKHLEKNGFAVIAGYLSPSHDLHVMCKLSNEDVILAPDRCSLIRDSIESSSWIDLSSWY
eukprot:TRINITY_DN14662_c0_g1_i1.p1 TRINITY_DN14662_c0_g1~~TRINITY_DN14662_c0_g1_i1.p1  ORF type:complete len:131 (+),score=19.46 TRINITY_DN14662_c0_g1_i1:38-430(+)